MAVIHVLDKHTAELIAAGEVVERPASVVKELLENAIDAGAKQITVSILRGGVQQIEVADNGCGIEAEYLATAFIRHATSKIASEQDLDSIQTLGFRGEALASIASVAKIRLLTCTEQDEYANCYRIEGGEELGVEPAARSVGTTITVADLFYNTPARMKFLKKDSSEGTFVAETVQRTALSHPEVSIAFVREGKQQFRTPGSGERKAAVYTVLGRDFSKDLLTVDSESGLYQVKGLITPPRACRASRGMQYFYINGRFVKNRTMMAALEAAYKGTLMQGKFPGCVLELILPPDLVDVNVHPAKTEVRFAQEQDVFNAVYKAAKVALSVPQAGQQELKLPEPKSEPASLYPKPQQPSVVNPVKQEREKPVELPQPKQESQEKITITTRNPSVFSTFSSSSLPYTVHRREPELDVLVEDEFLSEIEEEQPGETSAIEPQQIPKTESVQPVPSSDVQADQTAFLPKETETNPLQLVGEVFGTYIVTQRNQELCFIDKHAAHERLLYEKLLKEKGKTCGQLLLAPVNVQLSAEEKTALLQNAALLLENGIEIEDFGGNSVLARTVPADISPDDTEDMIVELANKLITNSKDALSEKSEWVMHSIACRAAVKAGDKNNKAELLHLAKQILDGEVPPFCPHGRPVILKLTQKELEKQFGRQG